jgi:hypothetical protein
MLINTLFFDISYYSSWQLMFTEHVYNFHALFSNMGVKFVKHGTWDGHFFFRLKFLLLTPVAKACPTPV